MANWISVLTEHDLLFVKNFVLASGSLKTVAEHYEVSYPTIRQRLNLVIEKIAATSDEADEFVLRVRALAVEKKIAAELIDEIVRIHEEQGTQR